MNACQLVLCKSKPVAAHAELPPYLADSALTAPTAQVIVPSIGSGSGAGLNDWRGWLGFGLSLASMAATVVYFVSLQASRRLGFTSLQLQVGHGAAALCCTACCDSMRVCAVVGLAVLCFAMPCMLFCFRTAGRIAHPAHRQVCRLLALYPTTPSVSFRLPSAVPLPPAVCSGAAAHFPGCGWHRLVGQLPGLDRWRLGSAVRHVLLRRHLRQPLHPVQVRAHGCRLLMLCCAPGSTLMYVYVHSMSRLLWEEWGLVTCAVVQWWRPLLAPAARSQAPAPVLRPAVLAARGCWAPPLCPCSTACAWWPPLWRAKSYLGQPSSRSLCRQGQEAGLNEASTRAACHMRVLHAT